MATDEPLRDDDLPSQLREQGSENSRSQTDDPTQPMSGDQLHRPGELSEDAARDAMMRPGDPASHIEQLGLVKRPASDAGAGDDAKQPEGQDAADKPPSAADKRAVDDPVSDGESASAAAEAAEEESVNEAPDTPPTASAAASPVSDEASDEDGAGLEADDESSPADGTSAESMNDSDGAVAPDLPPASTPEETAAVADTPSMTTDNSSATADAPATTAAGSPPSVPAASPGLAPEQVTSAARSQQHDGELPPRTTEMLTPGADGQPPMARPIVLVRHTDDQTHRMINDALAKLAADSSELMESIAADHVDYIFWQIRAQERAILRFD